jgi:TPR repeat protein
MTIKTSIAAIGIALAVLIQPTMAQTLEDAAVAYERGDFDTALELYRQLAEQGNAQAQYSLCVMYDKVEVIVSSDYSEAEAVRWCHKAAQQGHADAQYRLGPRYYWGWGVQQDRAEAAKWYRRAAEQGHVAAQYELGFMCEFGEGVPQDYTEAATWYRKAAEQGHVEAQYQIGSMYDIGEGVPQDYTEAAKWFHKTVENGSGGSNGLEARFALGRLYYRGEGVPRDPVLAYMWLSLARMKREGEDDSWTSLGRPRWQARDLLDMLVKEMNADQIAEAKRLAEEWWAAHPDVRR